MSKFRYFNMSGIRVLLILTLAAGYTGIISCFGDDPVKSNNDGDDPENPYSGTFSLSSTLEANTCAIPVSPGLTVNITVRGDSIWFGMFPGEWDSLSTSGGGSSPEVTVPVTPPTCYSYYTVTYELEFSDENNFIGVYRTDFRKDPGCPNPEPCSFTYSMTGSRE